jgi:hypothetical protein
MKHSICPQRQTAERDAARHAIKAAKAISKATAKAAAKAAKAATKAAKAATKEAKAEANAAASIQRQDPAFWKENPEADGRIHTMATLIRQAGFIKHERLLAQSLLVPYAEWLLTVDKICRCGSCDNHKLNRWELMKEFVNSIMD